MLSIVFLICYNVEHRIWLDSCMAKAISVYETMIAIMTWRLCCYAESRLCCYGGWAFMNVNNPQTDNTFNR